MHGTPLRTLRQVLIGIMLCSLALAVVEVRTVRAESVTANVFTDPPPGACASSGTGNCSLREAILFANTNPTPNSPVTIMLLAGTYALTIGPSGNDDAQTGDLNLTNTGATILGVSSGRTIIDASGMMPSRDRVLSVDNSTVTISGVTLRGGQTASTTGGGGIVAPNSSLRFTDVDLSTNAATNGNGGGFAGSGATFTFINVTLNDNTAGGNGGGLYSNNSAGHITGGGATNNQATGTGSVGGGIDIDGGSLTIDNATISGNSATNGGGIASTDITTTEITASTVSGNSATTNGGGVFNSNGSLMALSNSTLSGNSAATGGGGYGSGGGSGTSELIFGSATVAMNTSGVFSSSALGPSQLSLGGTILANTTADCTSPDGSITSSGYNLVNDSSCTSIALATDQLNANPLLGPLQLNAPGTTATQALLPGSPAVDRIPATGAGCPASDQRGIPRPQPVSGRCDIGAYEAAHPNPLPPPQPTGPSQGGPPAPLPPPKAAGLPTSGGPPAPLPPGRP